VFIFSMKFDKKKAIAIILGIAVILCAIILLGGRRDTQETSATTQRVNSHEDIEAYLESLGWKISDKPVDVQDILIPKEFSETYEEYNKLQKSQGFDLTEYCGIDAVRYTYEILNYPEGNGTIVADIIVAKDTIIAADIQSVKLDGFMHELRENT